MSGHDDTYEESRERADRLVGRIAEELDQEFDIVTREALVALLLRYSRVKDSV